MIGKLLMAAAANAGVKPGQVVFETAGTTDWTVPPGVTSISAVVVDSGSSSGAKISIGQTVVCRASPRVGDGGGNGGQFGQTMNTVYGYRAGGAGGAGGYTGDGGGGATYEGVWATPGKGGGGGGGGDWNGYTTGAGGGVGLKGAGPNGSAAPYSGADGGPGSYGSGRDYGGGAPSTNSASGSRGGSLAYKNNIPVTPGQVITIYLPPAYYGAGKAGARIMWGENRAYPSTNTGDM